MRDDAMIAVVMTVDVAWHSALYGLRTFFGLWIAALNLLKLPFLAVMEDGDCGSKR
jgi:hypothetical protein